MNLTIPTSYALYYVNVADIIWAILQPIGFVAIFLGLGYWAYHLLDKSLGK